ncbi:MAG: hypothetical protein GX643_03490 [Acidimicrobiales bacterium]|nr:hypothetical protein [Acidimicrobiales bacterium]
MRIRPAWTVGLGAAVVMVVRLWASWTSRVPQVVADETAYLAMARYLSGGPSWNLGESAAYMPLYSIVIAPAEVLGLSPDSVYRWAVATNVVLAGLTFVVIERLARRITSLSPPWTSAVAALATTVPALVLSSRFVWSDNLAPVFFALIVLAGLRLLEDPTPASVALFSLCGVAGYLAHSRFLTVMAVMGATLVILAVRRAVSWGVVGAALVAMAVGVLLGDLLVEHLAAELNMAGRESSEFTRIFRIPDLALAVLGQVWYLTVTTGGLALVGACALIHAAWARYRRRDGDGGDDDVVEGSPVPLGGGELAFLIALVAVCFGTSAGFMTDRPRPDQLVYGRYNDMFVAPLVVVGMAAMATAWTWRRALAVTGAAVVVAVGAAQILHHSRFDLLTGPFVPNTVMGLFALDPLATQRVRSIAVAAIVVIVVIALLGWVAQASGRIWVLLGGCAFLVAVGVNRAHATFEERYVHPDPSAVVEVERLLDDSGRSGDEVVCAMTAGCPLLNFYRYQFYLPGRSFQLRWDESWRSAPVVLGGQEGADADLLAGLGYEMLWSDPSSHGSVWVR